MITSLSPFLYSVHHETAVFSPNWKILWKHFLVYLQRLMITSSFPLILCLPQHKTAVFVFPTGLSKNFGKILYGSMQSYWYTQVINIPARQAKQQTCFMVTSFQDLVFISTSILHSPQHKTAGMAVQELCKSTLWQHVSYWYFQVINTPGRLAKTASLFYGSYNAELMITRSLSLYSVHNHMKPQSLIFTKSCKTYTLCSIPVTVCRMLDQSQ